MSFVPILKKISNLLAYIFLLTANVYSGLGPDRDDSPYNDSHDTYITPAPFVFGIWAVIHFLLGGLVIYQFFDRATETVVDGIGWNFVSISIFSALWVYLWQLDHLILAFITVLIVLLQVSYVYQKLKVKFPSQGLNDTLWIHAPFSLYHAWIAVVFVISFFAAFTPEKNDVDDNGKGGDGGKGGDDEDRNDGQPSVLIQILVFIGLATLASTVHGYIYNAKGDVIGAIVISWSLYGIFVAQEDPFIHWSALSFAILSSIYIVGALYKKYFCRSGEDSTPLLG